VLPARCFFLACTEHVEVSTVPYVIDSMQNVVDSLHDELFIIKVELGRHELTRDYFFEKHPKLQLEYENFINHETE
jgi:hypothetical protein